jgi:sulfide:quinone oxidoreductase
MKKLVILGAGTAGTMMLNKLNDALDKAEWQITIVDQFETHYYQPGFLFIPFGIYNKKDVIKPKRDFLPPGTTLSCLQSRRSNRKRTGYQSMPGSFCFLILDS